MGELYFKFGTETAWEIWHLWILRLNTCGFKWEILALNCYKYVWLVVWNMTCFFPSYWECHHPNWRTHIFQRGRAQPPTRYDYVDLNWNEDWSRQNVAIKPDIGELICKKKPVWNYSMVAKARKGQECKVIFLRYPRNGKGERWWCTLW